MLSLSQKHTTYSNTRTSDAAVHQYIDVDVVNNRTLDSFGSTPMAPAPLIFNQIKLHNIVDNCSDYYISVIRWQMDSIIPVIIPQIPIHPEGRPIANPKLIETIYGLSFSTGIDEPTNYISASKQIVYFFTDDLSATKPTYYPRSQEEIYQNPFYSVFTVQSFLDCINIAISASIDDWGGRPAGSVNPKFVWNSAEGKIEYIVSDDYIFRRGRSTGENIFLNVNTALYNLLNSFGFKCINPTRTGDENFNSYSLYLYDQQQRFKYGYDVGNTSVEMIIYTQDSCSVPSWTPCTSLQFTTATIPVNPTATSAPLFLGDNLRSTLAASAQSNVITDFQIPLTTGTELTGQLYYAPSSEYRLFDLVTNGPLQQLNIEVSWLDKYGFSHPFLLKNGGTASLKLMLRKKDF